MFGDLSKGKMINMGVMIPLSRYKQIVQICSLNQFVLGILFFGPRAGLFSVKI